MSSNKYRALCAVADKWGFRVEGTGGGCEALARHQGEACILITNDNAEVPSPGEQWIVGVYLVYEDCGPPDHEWYGTDAVGLDAFLQEHVR